ncbi:MAG TPA: tetratricopeptide repeat protein [Gammaproteobacteria bacterium]|nr:tetratricopeptide repeat protein [Gammaproteobacteria bacterium]
MNAARLPPWLGALALAAATLSSACRHEADAWDAFSQGDYETSLRAAREIAQDQDDPAALNFVGIHYYLGTGVVRDFAEARRWFERAARLGDANAQRNLGMLYLRGLGVRRDEFLAYAWFTEAVERGNRRATAYLALLSDALTPSQMVKARHALDGEIGQRAAD